MTQHEKLRASARRLLDLSRATTAEGLRSRYLEQASILAQKAEALDRPIGKSINPESGAKEQPRGAGA